jgi:hypothetical protein
VLIGSSRILRRGELEGARVAVHWNRNQRSCRTLSAQGAHPLIESSATAFEFACANSGTGADVKKELLEFARDALELVALNPSQRPVRGRVSEVVCERLKRRNALIERFGCRRSRHPVRINDERSRSDKAIERNCLDASRDARKLNSFCIREWPVCCRVNEPDRISL